MDLKNAILHVRRVKQGTPATQPLAAAELRALWLGSGAVTIGVGRATRP